MDSETESETDTTAVAVKVPSSQAKVGPDVPVHDPKVSRWVIHVLHLYAPQVSQPIACGRESTCKCCGLWSTKISAISRSEASSLRSLLRYSPTPYATVFGMLLPPSMPRISCWQSLGFCLHVPRERSCSTPPYEALFSVGEPPRARPYPHRPPPHLASTEHWTPLDSSHEIQRLEHLQSPLPRQVATRSRPNRRFWTCMFGAIGGNDFSACIQELALPHDVAHMKLQVSASPGPDT